MKLNSPIQLLDGATRCFTHWPIIAVMCEKLKVFDSLPTHVTIRESRYYGHCIYETYEGSDQFLNLSADPDEKWLEANPNKKPMPVRAEPAADIVVQMLGRATAGKPLPTHVDIPGPYYGWPLGLVQSNCSTRWELGDGPDQEWIENNPLDGEHLAPGA